MILLLSSSLITAVKLMVGAYPRWEGTAPSDTQRIYFANHSSHMDTLVLWSALPPALRAQTRPVAAKDYWGGSAFRRYISGKGFNVVLIERARQDRSIDPLQPLYEVLSSGQSLIIFPEGTRKPQALPDPFKSGLYHLSQRFPNVELVPVYLENLHRSMPKGTFFPLPLICTVRFGAPLARNVNETKEDFLLRARQQVVALA
jgi:1-acyl-sn-glycerol-3-phosphate acyltransferase